MAATPSSRPLRPRIDSFRSGSRSRHLASKASGSRSLNPAWKGMQAPQLNNQIIPGGMIWLFSWGACCNKNMF